MTGLAVVVGRDPSSERLSGDTIYPLTFGLRGRAIHGARMINNRENYTSLEAELNSADCYLEKGTRLASRRL